MAAALQNYRFFINHENIYCTFPCLLNTESVTRTKYCVPLLSPSPLFRVDQIIDNTYHLGLCK